MAQSNGTRKRKYSAIEYDDDHDDDYVEMLTKNVDLILIKKNNITKKLKNNEDEPKKGNKLKYPSFITLQNKLTLIVV